MHTDPTRRPVLVASLVGLVPALVAVVCTSRAAMWLILEWIGDRAGNPFVDSQQIDFASASAVAGSAAIIAGVLTWLATAVLALTLGAEPEPDEAPR